MNSILTVIGPTAVGKTKIAVEVAKKKSGEIISADSRQIYKYLDIGTAKPTKSERKKCNFHLIDFVDPNDSYSAGRFSRDAMTKIAQIKRAGRYPIICGGTGLYIKALFNPLHDLPHSDKKIKEKLIHLLKERGVAHLYEKLCLIDPTWANKVMPRDRQRILRGLEVYEITGNPLSVLLKKNKITSKYLPYYIGLNISRKELYQKIDKRFDTMLQNGLIDEVKFLLKNGYAPQSNALRTIGYREIIKYLRGQTTLEEATNKVKQRTRNFAKRQLSWFRKIPDVRWLNPNDPGIVKKILALLG